jgi:HAE1 family hydrophobic/amphiphilic exporter-1
MLAARWIKAPKGHKTGDEFEGYGAAAEAFDADGAEIKHEAGSDSKAGFIYRIVENTYRALLKLSLRFRWVIVLVCVIVVISIYPLFRYVGMAFVPDEDESTFQVSLRGPQGTSLAATQSILDRIARDIREQLKGVQNTLVFAGGFGGGGGGSTNAGSITVTLVPPKDRPSSQNDLINQTRQIAKKYSSKDYRVTVSGVSSIGASIGLGRGGSSIGYYISGPDMDQLNDYANQLVEKMRGDPIFRDPDSSVDAGTPEVQFVIDRQRAADLNVKAADIARALNTLAAGQRVSTFSEGTNQYDVIVQADEPFRRTRDSLKYFTVAGSPAGQPASANQSSAQNTTNATRSPTGNLEVPLEQLVKIQTGLSPASIARLNRQRQVTVSASIPPGGSESDALAKLEGYVKELNLPAEYTAGVTGQSKELQRAYGAFLYAFLLSFVFMYLILAAQFESFIHPVTILLTLPLAVPFALISTAIAGQTLNIFSALGILLLFGIVKKNAILQIDHTNNLRSQGMSRYDALIQANLDRLRPILMTTIALVAGMIPLIVGSGAGAATNRSIGILVVGGQSLCLLLTLLAVPVFYSLFDDAKESSIFRGISSSVAEPIRRLLRRRRTESETGEAFVEEAPEN